MLGQAVGGRAGREDHRLARGGDLLGEREDGFARDMHVEDRTVTREEMAGIIAGL